MKALAFSRLPRSLLLIGFLTVQMIVSPPANASPGDLDPSFGSGGWAETHFGGPYAVAAAVAIQSDGKIVIAGIAFRRFALARYFPDGTLDTGFGGDGRSIISFKPARSAASVLAIQSDGKLIVAGSVAVGPNGRKRTGMAVARLLPDGSLDPSFGGGDGIARVTFDAWVGTRAVEVLADGSIMLGGPRFKPGTSRAGFAIARLTPTGVLDESFGSGGRAVCGAGHYSVEGVAFDGSKVVAVGTGHGRFVVARCSLDGVPDPSFASRGFRRYELGPPASWEVEASHVAVDLGGRIVVGVTGWVTRYNPQLSNYLCGVVRLTTDGSWDTTFSSDGFAFTGPFNDCGGNVAIQEDGGILLDGGNMGAGSGEDSCFFTRFATDGSSDPTFGSDGTVEVQGPGGGFTWPCGSMALQADGKVVSVSGYDDNTMRVVRLLAS
jgi:uncharacterized delta-60 repeat protein